MPISERPSVAQMENLLAVLCQDERHGRIVANLAQPELFEGDYRILAERFIRYWRQYNRPPGVHAPDLLADIIEDSSSRRAASLRRVLLGLAGLAENLNITYVLDSLQQFTRLQTLKDAILRAAQAINANPDASIEEVERILGEVMRARQILFERGTRLDDDLDPLLEYLSEQRGEFITGIEPLDRRGIVPARGTVLLFVAGKGRGKTWFLINVSKMALQLRKRVLHISLENSAMETRVRYYQALFAAPQRLAGDESVRISNFQRDPDGRIERIGYEEFRPDFALNSRDVRAELETRISRMDRQLDNLIIKRFPNRSLTIEGLTGYLDALEQVDGFMPDLVVLDYPKLMKLGGRNADDRRVAIGDTMERLRGLAVERNFALATVDQLNREGYKRRQARSTDIAEDWTEIHTSDKVLIHSATDAERRRGLCRIYVEHARTEEDKFTVLLCQNFNIGQFCLDAALLPHDYLDNLLREQGEADDAEGEEDAA